MSDVDEDDVCYRMLVVGPTGRCLIEMRDNRVNIKMNPQHQHASTLVVERKHRIYVLLRGHPDMKKQYVREMDQIMNMIEGHTEHPILFHGVAECILSRIYMYAEPVRNLLIESLIFKFGNKFGDDESDTALSEP